MSKEEVQEEMLGSKMGQFMRHFIKSNDQQAISVEKSHEETGFAFEYQEREPEKDENQLKGKRGKGRPKGNGRKKQGILKEQKPYKNNEDNDGDSLMDSDLQLEEVTKTIKRKRGRPSKKSIQQLLAVKKFYLEQDNDRGEEENTSKIIEKRKRGRPPKVKQESTKTAPKPKTIAKTDQVEPQAKKRLLKRIRDKLAGREEQQLEVIIDVEDHEKKKLNADSYPNSLKTITIKPRQNFQILQIKRKEDGLNYLVQIGQIIKWATKQDLVEDFALEVIGFFQNRLMAQQNESKIKEKSNLYVRYQ